MLKDAAVTFLQALRKLLSTSSAVSLFAKCPALVQSAGAVRKLLQRSAILLVVEVSFVQGGLVSAVRIEFCAELRLVKSSSPMKRSLVRVTILFWMVQTI